MTAMVGADIEGLRAFAAKLDTSSQRFDAIMSELQGPISDHNLWLGSDGDDFRNVWNGALRVRLQDVGRRIGEIARDINRQADDQERTSSDGGSGGGTGGVTGGHGGPIEIDDTTDGGSGGNTVNGRDTGDWTPGGLGTGGEDPGENVQYPPGLDPNSDIAKELASTPRGRQILQWMADHNTQVIQDPNAQGAWYSDGKMVLGSGNADASTVIHEAVHAQHDAEGWNPDYHGSKEDYVSGMINQETDAVWTEVQAAKEARASGQDAPPVLGEDRYDNAFNQTYDQAIADGQSPTEATQAADQAGRQAINQMFYDGGAITSTTGETYADYYGNSWEAGN